ncbi:MAG TPA: glycosyltransferase family 39 protein, partial [Dehalococcoidia bacterium]|nr:glycosyltransferase family 39 protein [Dehalococcoidia bacterium]
IEVAGVEERAAKRDLPAWLTSAWAIDVAFVVAIALVALIVRTYDLAVYPHGLHGDEASTGLDARKSLDGEDLWPYTLAALGQPSGPMYWTAPFVKVMGSTIVAVRLPMALLGVGTVVLGFFALRELFDRPTAWIGAVLLALSSWLIFYNRTGYTVSAMPFTEFASLLAVALALRTRWWPWYVVAGFIVGAGIYGYYSYPLFAFGLGVFVLVHWAIERPKPQIVHARNVLVMGLVALLTIQSMWPYITSDDVGYKHDRKVFAVSNSERYRQEDTLGRVDLYWENAKDLAQTLLVDGIPDASDGSGTTPALDLTLVVFGGAGMGVCAILAWRRRRAAYLLPWIIMPIILVGPLWSEGGYHRRSLGILPFVVMAAAVLLGYVWQSLTWSRPAYRTLITGALVLLLGGYAGTNLVRYFDEPRDQEVVKFVYSPELTHAANFMRQEGAGTKIYYAADRWSVNYETLRYLDPEHSVDEGNAEDRSREFAKEGVTPGFEGLDRTRPATIVLMSAYRANADTLAARYPEATVLNGPTVDGMPAFIALRIAPR